MKKLMLYFNIFMLFLLTGCLNNEETTIGIIGGTDYQTAKYFASIIIDRIINISTVIIIIAVVIGIIIYLIRKKK